MDKYSGTGQMKPATKEREEGRILNLSKELDKRLEVLQNNLNSLLNIIEPVLKIELPTPTKDTNIKEAVSENSRLANSIYSQIDVVDIMSGKISYSIDRLEL